MVAKLDAFILDRLTRFCHWFQRLTGKTNYFLAKIFLFLALNSILVRIINHWIPLLGYETYLFFEILIALVIFPLYINDIYSCDKSENRLLSGNELSKERFYSVNLNSIFWRILWLLLALIDVLSFISVFYTQRGVLLFKLLDDFALFIFLVSYLLNVEPLPPGKSKIKEWIESFQTGFLKLQPAKSPPNRS